MADHGLTGTHHIDGSPCTMTAACPWSATAWLKTALPGSATTLQAMAVQAVAAAPWCECCQRRVLTPYHHDNHNPPYDGYDYCQACYDAGCGDPSDVCNWTSDGESPGGPVSTNPITPLMLREDWIDNPNLSKSDKAVLESLHAAQLQQALDEAYTTLGYDDVWYNLLDNVRSKATETLLASVPTADSAPDGTQDECLNCSLPITRHGDVWRDDIMNSKGCMSNADTGVHNPKAVLAAYLKALQDGAKKQDAKASPRAGTPILFVLSNEGSDREDGNVWYSTYLMFNEPVSRFTDIQTVLVGLLQGNPTNDGVEFKRGQSPLVDDLWEDHDMLVAEIAKHGFDVFSVTPAYITGNE